MFIWEGFTSLWLTLITEIFLCRHTKVFYWLPTNWNYSCDNFEKKNIYWLYKTTLEIGYEAWRSPWWWMMEMARKLIESWKIFVLTLFALVQCWHFDCCVDQVTVDGKLLLLYLQKMKHGSGLVLLKNCTHFQILISPLIDHHCK